jgi:hypothetical protein
VIKVRKQRKTKGQIQIFHHIFPNVQSQIKEFTWTCLDLLKRQEVAKVHPVYVELVAIADETGNRSFFSIVQQMDMHHVLPLEIVSDRGKEFCSEVVNDILKLLSIQNNISLQSPG